MSKHLTLILASTASIAACDIDDSHVKVVRTQLSEPAPAGAAQPRAITSLADAIDQTSAVVEATVSATEYEYTDEEGPWTRVALGNIQVHIGSAPAKLELLQFGGPTPKGDFVGVSELPTFEKGERYVVFLRNTAWNLSPVVGDMAFRVASIDGTEMLVTADGQPVLQVGKSGTELGPAIFQPSPPSPLFATASSAAPHAISSLARRPLDRQRFLVALRSQLDAQKLSVSGPLYTRPAGHFRWRQQPVARQGDATGSAGVDSHSK